MTIPAEDRAKLVGLARQAIEARLRGKPTPQAEPSTGILAEMRGCFVTLTNAGRLRGCIGNFRPDAPLGEMVVRMASAAVAEDPRFVTDPVTVAELGDLTVEVSVLSPLTETDQPAKLQVGTHGIYIVRGGQSGCFLPEVATDHGWGAGQFLTECCISKAHLPADAWKDPDTTVYLFTSEKFDH